ncbi:MAG TPA: thiol-disulfide oxidoreductase DCC family protein [Bacteroidales bacterium]|nr:thiol-disulfide oxidoreductase DCC family protein [Bacteroidales bacterium]
MEKLPRNKGIILFDGYCNLCSGSVQFIIKRDLKNYFKFASLQSEVGKNLHKKFCLPENYNESVVLIVDEKIFLKSDALIKITQKLKGLWPLLAVFKIFPKSLRNLIYDFIANHRFRWFGMKEQCFMPSKSIKERFL